MEKTIVIKTYNKLVRDHFHFDAEVSLSPTFFSWIFEFGGMIRIAGPEHVREEFQKMLQRFFV